MKEPFRSIAWRPMAVLAVATFVGACSGGSSPTSPPPTPQPVVQVSFEPSQVRATVVKAVEGTTTYRVEATVWFTETAGTGGQITQLRGTIVRSSGGSTSGTLSVALSLPARGSVSGVYFQEFDLTETADIVWQFSGSGVDSTGRAFDTQVGQVAVLPPAPPPLPPATARLELYGGQGFTQYLGCLSCNEFVRDSVFNQFGPHGSRFSSISIWNNFSPYGSQFSSHSPCNLFASNPPRVVNTANNTYVELTLNTFRTFAWRDPVILGWLENSVCQ